MCNISPSVSNTRGGTNKHLFHILASDILVQWSSFTWKSNSIDHMSIDHMSIPSAVYRLETFGEDLSGQKSSLKLLGSSAVEL